MIPIIEDHILNKCKIFKFELERFKLFIKSCEINIQSIFELCDCIVKYHIFKEMKVDLDRNQICEIRNHST